MTGSRRFRCSRKFRELLGSAGGRVLHYSPLREVASSQLAASAGGDVSRRQRLRILRRRKAMDCRPNQLLSQFWRGNGNSRGGSGMDGFYSGSFGAPGVAAGDGREARVTVLGTRPVLVTPTRGVGSAHSGCRFCPFRGVGSAHSGVLVLPTMGCWFLESSGWSGLRRRLRAMVREACLGALCVSLDGHIVIIRRLCCAAVVVCLGRRWLIVVDGSQMANRCACAACSHRVDRANRSQVALLGTLGARCHGVAGFTAVEASAFLDQDAFELWV